MQIERSSSSDRRVAQNEQRFTKRVADESAQRRETFKVHMQTSDAVREPSKVGQVLNAKA